MSPKKIIAVIGATGVQGGSVAKYLLEEGTFTVRAITRNTESDAAKALSAQGAQVFKADSRDSGSLRKAFEGAYGVFGVTNFWENGVGAEGEVTQGKKLVDAAKDAGIKHFVWSTLDRSEFKAAHWESKADVDDYLKASGVPRTSIYTAFYFENFLQLMSLRKRNDGSYDFPVPLTTDASFAVFSVAEIGAYALAAFKNPSEWIGNDLRVASEFLSVRQMSSVISEVSGKTVHVKEVTPELFETFKNNPIPEELHANFLVQFAYNKAPYRDPELSRRVNPGMKTFRVWVEEHIGNIVN